jgi:serine/threonine protein kinase
MKLLAVDNSKISYDIEINLDQKIGEGATASIYKVYLNNQLQAAKIYKADRKISTEKLEAMLVSSPNETEFNDEGQIFIKFTWVKYLLKDKSNKIVGFIMPFVDQNSTNSLDTYYDPVLIKRLNSKTHSALSLRLEIALNLCRSVHELHALGHHFIDIKPQNIRVYRDNNKVVLMDCDGYSIKNDRPPPERFPAELISTDYIAPEVIKNHLSPQTLGQEQDCYGLAVIIFQLLNFGTHPFQGIVKDSNIQATTNDDRAAIWLYPYGLLGHPNVMPRKQSVHNLFLHETRALFDRAFTSTNRPTALEWVNHINEILTKKLIVRCKLFPSDISHIHFKNFGCIGCKVEENVKNSLQSKNKGTTYKVPPVNIPNSINNQQTASTSYKQTSQPPINKTYENKWAVISSIAVCVFIFVLWLNDASNKNTSKGSIGDTLPQQSQNSSAVENCKTVKNLSTTEICTHYKMNTYPICQDILIGEIRNRGLITEPISKCGESPTPYIAKENTEVSKENSSKSLSMEEKINYLKQKSNSSRISASSIEHDAQAKEYYRNVEEDILRAIKKSTLAKVDGLDVISNFDVPYISSMNFSGHLGETCLSQSIGTVTRCIISGKEAKCQNLEGAQYKKICLESFSK